MAMAININAIHEKNSIDIDIKQMIEAAGCVFYETKQWIRKNVCLEAYYERYEPPIDVNGHTNVDVDLWKPPRILEIDEKINRITIQVGHYMEWQDSRIKINISAMSKLSHDASYIKFAPAMVEKIWHPNLDLNIHNC